MNNGQMQTTYTSPDTGKLYHIIESQSERGAWDENGNYAPKVVTQYSIYDDMKMVQFAFDENGIAASVRHYEGFHDGWTSSRFD